MSAKEMGARIKAATSDAVNESRKHVMKHAKDFTVINVKDEKQKLEAFKMVIDDVTAHIEETLGKLGEHTSINGAYEAEIKQLIKYENLLEEFQRAKREQEAKATAPLGKD